MQISETAPLNAKQTNNYDLDLPTVTNDGERRPFIEDEDDDVSVHSDTSFPESVEEGLRPTNVTDADVATTEEEPAAWKTLVGMTLVAIGTALFCTNGAIVQKHGGSILQLMLGRYCVQNILSSCIWISNPCNIRQKGPNGTAAVHWYGDGAATKYIWLRGLALFCTVFFWWRGLELVPLGIYCPYPRILAL